ncbi:DUF1929 domain-containing protein [Microvirga sp. SRT01]|uniref:DUF1929 domain-containing protein n=1 Tax=Sphingomonas longa TaxID=2778730 RepID=A0ABS2D2A9_9SPHN|nr:MULTISPECIES: glyoxal oxidase [Alphaproteobacteria]MBM6575061.1 DUF1929 domain-containing protein [Sphingomonas sp. BT552]MBR7708112.1 DUF1929 domain-containing protein [Microvirga sp. SRT01]
MLPTTPPPRCRAARRGFLFATAASAMLVPAIASAQQFPVVVAQVQDPAMQNLAIPEGADVHGMWSGVKDWPLIGIHSALLPNGKVVTYGSPNGTAAQSGRVYDIWDPTRGFGRESHLTLTGVADVDSFCSAATFLDDGSLLIAGGIFSEGNDRGSVLVDQTGSSLRGLGRNMAYDRYYATMVTLNDGRPLIVGGSYPYQDVNNFVPEVYNPNGWASLFGAADTLVFSRAEGRFWYPHVWQAPNGRVFGISTEQLWWMDPQGNGSIARAGVLKRAHTYDRIPANQLPNVGPTSTAVMFDVGRVLQLGGNGQQNGDATYSSSAATVIDINGAAPVQREAAPMIHGRQWANAIVLPTGTVMVNGGSLWGDEAGWSDARPVELWDKNTNAWTLGAAAGVYRGYHSSSLLLTNGTVLTSGGGVPGPVVNLNSEIYYPPYLFQRVNGRMQLAPRPQIVSLQTTKLNHGQSAQVEMANANPIRSVSLVRLGQDTHSFDSGQRYIPATYFQTGAVLTVQAPASTSVAPPGYYMLVAADADGVPSTGVIVAIGGAITAPPGVPRAPVGSISNAANAALTGGGTTVDGPSYEWRNCAGEGGTCNGPAGSTMRYGVGDLWSLRANSTSILCSVNAFGDPAPNRGKTCQIMVPLNPGVTRAPAAQVPNPPPAPGPGPTPPLPAGSWSACAREGQTCTVPTSTTLRYGANGTYVVRTVTGATACNNEVFGDPLVGVVKGCDRFVPEATPTPTPGGGTPLLAGAWTMCAGEGERCVAPAGATIRFGANGLYAVLTNTGTVACANGVFGDPVKGTVKRCDVAPAAVWAACGNEGGQCDLPAGAMIRYGAGTRWATLVAKGVTACTNVVFGDPVPGTVKACQRLIAAN